MHPIHIIHIGFNILCWCLGAVLGFRYGQRYYHREIARAQQHSLLLAVGGWMAFTLLGFMLGSIAGSVLYGLFGWLISWLVGFAIFFGIIYLLMLRKPHHSA